MVSIRDDLEISDRELSFQTSRSGGPGGQNVNKVETRVTLLFDLASSQAISEEEKELLRRRLGRRLGRDGVVRLSSQRHRTQAANRKEVTERFARILRKALRKDPPRRRTKPSRAARGRRLREKRHRAEIKRRRRAPDPGED